MRQILPSYLVNSELSYRKVQIYPQELVHVGNKWMLSAPRVDAWQMSRWVSLPASCPMCYSKACNMGRMQHALVLDRLDDRQDYRSLLLQENQNPTHSEMLS